jgi:hypothetical protein
VARAAAIYIDLTADVRAWVSNMIDGFDIETRVRRTTVAKGMVVQRSRILEAE